MKQAENNGQDTHSYPKHTQRHTHKPLENERIKIGSHSIRTLKFSLLFLRDQKGGFAASNFHLHHLSQKGKKEGRNPGRGKLVALF